MTTPIRPTAELITPKFISGLSLLAILPAQVAATAPSANPVGILKNARCTGSVARTLKRLNRNITLAPIKKTFLEFVIWVSLAKKKFPKAMENISNEINFPASALVKLNDSLIPSILNAIPNEAAKQQIKTKAIEATSEALRLSGCDMLAIFPETFPDKLVQFYSTRLKSI